MDEDTIVSEINKDIRRILEFVLFANMQANNN